MEHEKIIRAKINELEKTPVVWNRGDVWASIDKGKASSPRPFVFYYAAALIVLAGAMIFFIVQSSRRNELENKIKSQELAIKTHSQKQTSQKETPGQCTDYVQQENNNHIVASQERVTEMNDTLPFLERGSIQQMADSSSQLLPLESMELVAEVAEKSNEEVQPEQATIEPIIGVYIPKEERVVTAKSKRLRIQLFNPQEKGTNSEPNIPFVLARIK